MAYDYSQYGGVLVARQDRMALRYPASSTLAAACPVSTIRKSSFAEPVSEVVSRPCSRTSTWWGCA